MNKKQEHLKPIDPQKFDKLIAKIAELDKIYGDDLNIDHIMDVLDIVSATDNHIIKGTSQEDGFFTFADIENLLLEQNRRLRDANLKSVFNRMKKMPGEKEIIDKKKRVQRSRNKGYELAILRKFHNYPRRQASVC
jgi:hypothetical protein